MLVIIDVQRAPDSDSDSDSVSFRGYGAPNDDRPWLAIVELPGYRARSMISSGGSRGTGVSSMTYLAEKFYLDANGVKCKKATWFDTQEEANAAVMKWMLRNVVEFAAAHYGASVGLVKSYLQVLDDRFVEEDDDRALFRYRYEGEKDA